MYVIKKFPKIIPLAKLSRFVSYRYWRRSIQILHAVKSLRVTGYTTSTALKQRSTTLSKMISFFTARCTLVQSAVFGSPVVCVRLSVGLSVTFVDHDHIGWKSWTLSLTPSLFVAQTAHAIHLLPLKLISVNAVNNFKRLHSNLNYTKWKHTLLIIKDIETERESRSIAGKCAMPQPL